MGPSQLSSRLLQVSATGHWGHLLNPSSAVFVARFAGVMLVSQLLSTLSHDSPGSEQSHFVSGFTLSVPGSQHGSQYWSPLGLAGVMLAAKFPRQVFDVVRLPRVPLQQSSGPGLFAALPR